MSTFNDFIKIINNLTNENPSEFCEQFLSDHESTMKVLFNSCSDEEFVFDNTDIKNYRVKMHSNVDFDDIICLGIELSENLLYKKFHPA